MRIVAISDTHGMHDRIMNVPDGDVLVHAGDSLWRGSLDELERLDAWISSLPHTQKILIAGNHDWIFEDDIDLATEIVQHATYLYDSSVVIDGIKFYGSPYTPTYFNWAFNLPRGEHLRRKWAEIPQDTNVLITHGPPKSLGDLVANNGRWQQVGCADLSRRLTHLHKLRVHIFGHIHEGYGIHKDPQHRAIFVNASTCDEHCQPVRPPIVIDI